jgi:hypothetical protein
VPIKWLSSPQNDLYQDPKMPLKNLFVFALQRGLKTKFPKKKKLFLFSLFLYLGFGPLS